jgi:HPt (histidine-containing phosphotransfer) domain-containing protein
MTTSPSLLYDLTILKMNSNNDDNFMREMIQLFKENGAASIQTLSKNCIDGTSHDWVEAAHLLKGGAAMIGSEHLRYLCENAQNQDPSTKSERSAALEIIKKSYTDVCQELKKDKLL